MKTKSLLASAILVTAATSAVATLRPNTLQEMPQPLEQHAFLQKGSGHWEGVMAWTLPDGTEQSTPAHESITNLGGFWTTGRFTCDFMGMPFEGVSSYGYDPAQEKFVGTWIDSMSNYMSIMKGDYDADKEVLEMRWRGPDQMGNADVPHRSEMRMTDNDYRLTFFVGEPETESMEIRMKRVKKKVVEAGHGR